MDDDTPTTSNYNDNGYTAEFERLKNTYYLLINQFYTSYFSFQLISGISI